MELRNYFSLFCLHQETQLIFIYLPITSHILGAFVNSQVQGHREVRLLVWKSFFYRPFRRVKSVLNWLLKSNKRTNNDGWYHWKDTFSSCGIWAGLHFTRASESPIYLCLFWNQTQHTVCISLVRCLYLNLIWQQFEEGFCGFWSSWR